MRVIYVCARERGGGRAGEGRGGASLKQESQHRMWENKCKRKHTNGQQTHVLFYVRRFPKKTGGSTAGRLPMLKKIKNKYVV